CCETAVRAESLLKVRCIRSSTGNPSTGSIALSWMHCSTSSPVTICGCSWIGRYPRTSCIRRDRRALPRAVGIRHVQVVRLVINNGYVQIEATDCVAHCSNPAFDASTFEVWGALLNGARVAILPHSTVLEHARFAEALRRYGVTILFQTTALFN